MLLKLKKTLLSQNQLGMHILHMCTTVDIQLKVVVNPYFVTK